MLKPQEQQWQSLKKMNSTRKVYVLKNMEEGFGFLKSHYLGFSRLPEPSFDGPTAGSGNSPLALRRTEN